MRGVLSSGGKPGEHLSLNSGDRQCLVAPFEGAVAGTVGFCFGAISSGTKFPDHAASIDLIKRPFGEPSILRMVICPDAGKTQNYIAAVSVPFGAQKAARPHAKRFPLAFRK
jgi:hypothetical protein